MKNPEIKLENRKLMVVLSDDALLERGEESQELECRWSYDWETGLKTLFRPDTGEAVGDPLVIADWEKQEHLDFERKRK